MIRARARKKKETQQKAIILFVGILVLILSTYLITKVINSKVMAIAGIYQESIDSDFEFYQSLIPLRDWKTEKPIIEARAASVAYIDPQGETKFIFEKNRDSKVPIASITKLMTVLIVLEQYNLEDIVSITKDDFLVDFTRVNNLYVGEQYRVKNLLYPLLMESSNAASYALAQKMGLNQFVDAMNEKAQELGMTNTFFIDPSGLDPSNASDTTNYSTVEDLTVLAQHLLKKDLIWEILSLSHFNLVRMDGYFKYTVTNTNALLEEVPEIIGGKTGTTTRARQCFLLVTKKNDGYLITTILGSANRFAETRSLLDWTNSGYYWEIEETN